MRDQRQQPATLSGKPRRKHLSPQDYDARNLECARIILSERTKYDRPDAAYMITWAEMVITRLSKDKTRGNGLQKL